MSDSAVTRPGIVWLYLGLVIATGGGAVAFSLHHLLAKPPTTDFYILVGLTILSGLLPVKLHKVVADISVSETFVFSAALLYGPPAGTLLVFLDALVIWTRLMRRGPIKWDRIFFSMTASALSMWVAGSLLFAVLGVPALSGAHRPDVWRFAAGLGVFTAVYFLLNSWLVALAIALEQRRPAWRLWAGNFLKTLGPNYLMPALLAALIAYNSYSIRVAVAFIVLPMFVLFWTLKNGEARIAQINRTFLQAIETLAMAIDAKDQVTAGHIRRVQRNSMALASALGIKDEDTLDALQAAALLHDTGKLHTPDYILNKPGKLTPAEFAKMKLHAAIGADILKNIDFPYPVTPMVRHHHERWDGKGYPDGLKEDAIPLGARILSVVDGYDAMTSDRPYRTGMTRPQAEKALCEGRGAAYDPAVVDAFIRILDRLEHLDAIERAATPAAPAHAELRPDRPVATSIASAEALLAQLRSVVPAATQVLYARGSSNELAVAACWGAGASEIADLRIALGDRMSGWAYANQQAVVNSEAALDLGPVARSVSPPLEYALVVPILDAGECVAVVGLYGANKFTGDDHRAVEAAAGLLRSGS